MVKIRKATPNSHSLEVSLPTGGSRRWKTHTLDARSAGYEDGRDADWELIDGKLVLKLRPKAEGAQVEVKSEEHTVVGGDSSATGNNPQG